MSYSKSLLRYLSCLSLVIIIACDQVVERQLPIYNPSDFNPDLVDRSLRNSSKYHTVSDFTLTNQQGKLITQEDYKGKIYVVDFFFTSCETICPMFKFFLVIYYIVYSLWDYLSYHMGQIVLPLS